MGREELLSEIHLLNQSNKLLEEELERVRKQREVLSHMLSSCQKRLTELERRGFWARLFNLQ